MHGNPLSRVSFLVYLVRYKAAMNAQPDPLHNLISGKAFEAQQDSLKARFAAHHIDYLHQYNNGAVPSLVVWLNHGNIPAKIEAFEDGRMDFSYFYNGRNQTESFINCSAEDFQMLLDYATGYLVDGGFDKDKKQWFEGLGRA